MIVINYTTTFKALDAHIQAYNNQTTDRSLQVRQSVTATAKEMIRIYGLSLVKANGIEKVDKENPPSLRTNNVQLSKLSHSSPRTVQRHIQKLIQARVITRKVWHGTNSSYEVWINPKILLVKEKQRPEAAKRQLQSVIEKTAFLAHKQYFFQDPTSKCPHTESGNTGNTTNIVIGVDNLTCTPRSSVCQAANHAGNTLTGHTGEKADRVAEGGPEGGREEAGEKAWNVRAGDQQREMNAPERPARSTTLDLYTRMLWILAKNVLYKHVYLTGWQETKATQLLRQWYEPVADHQLSRIHQIYIERITLARKYVQKDPVKRYIPLPHRYFDPTNPHGFAGTKKWWYAQEKWKRALRAKLILHAQIRRYLANQKKAVPLRTSPLMLYRECEQRISKLGDPELLQQFHAAILSPDSYDFIQPNRS